MTTANNSDSRQISKDWIFAPWHKEVIAELEKDFSIIETLMEAERRTAYLGLKLIYVKMRGKADRSIPHGQFQSWLARNFPKVPLSTAGYCMSKARSICERMGWKLQALPLHDVPPHRLMIDSAEKLPPEIQKSKQMLLDLVEMRGEFQPTQEYKQTKRGDDLGEDKHPRGRRPGEGGREAAPWDDIEALVKFSAKTALSKMGKVDQELGKLGVNFMSQPDDILTAWLGTLERTQRAVNAWLKTPLAKRNREAMEAVQELYRKS